MRADTHTLTHTLRHRWLCPQGPVNDPSQHKTREKRERMVTRLQRKERKLRLQKKLKRIEGEDVKRGKMRNEMSREQDKMGKRQRRIRDKRGFRGDKMGKRERREKDRVVGGHWRSVELSGAVSLTLSLSHSLSLFVSLSPPFSLSHSLSLVVCSFTGVCCGWLCSLGGGHLMALRDDCLLKHALYLSLMLFLSFSLSLSPVLSFFPP